MSRLAVWLATTLTSVPVASVSNVWMGTVVPVAAPGIRFQSSFAGIRLVFALSYTNGKWNLFETMHDHIAGTQKRIRKD